MKTKMQSGGTSLTPRPKRKVTQNMIAPKKGTVAPQPQKMIAQKGGSMKPPVKSVAKKKPSAKTQKDIDRAIWKQGQGWGQNQTMSLKTGGMVNPNANLQAQKVAGSKGVKSDVNPKASASSVATGRSGGTSVAPKTAVPKAQMGGMAGGRPISERAAARKVKKGKGMITKSYPSGPEEKGSYVGFSKEARKSNSPFKSMKDSKPARPIKKKGGMVKK